MAETGTIHVPLSPDPMLIYRNMEIAKKHRYGMPHGMALPPTYIWFYSMVHLHAPWDYKHANSRWRDFGNFNYGACGRAAGFAYEVLLRAAGWAQAQSGNRDPRDGHWWGRWPHGDSELDHKFIDLGYQFAVAKGY